MRESLRVRLVRWYALVLCLVVLLYGGAVWYQSWRSMIAGVDAELHVQALALAAALRPVDAQHFDLELAPDTLEYFRKEGDRRYYVIWNRSGDVVDRSDGDVQVPPAGRPAARTRLGRREVLVPSAAGATVLVGREFADVQRAHWSLALTVALAGAATLALAVVAGWFVAGRALSPIARISHAARAMSAGDLGARIRVDRTETELEQVASALNDAFDRLRLALDQQRRFAADASHELRTPLAVLRAEADWVLGRERSPEQYRQSLESCRRAAMRMQDTVERLLALARADTADRAPVTDAVPVRPLVDEVVAWLAPLAQEREVHVSVAGEPLSVEGDAVLVREALTNLVANAILYNKRGGQVSISSQRGQAHVRIEIADTGLGIPADALPHVFERFFRVDPARTRGAGGAGLGLSIASAIVEAHGGTISCTSEEGVGSSFVMRLPRAAAIS